MLPASLYSAVGSFSGYVEIREGETLVDTTDRFGGKVIECADLDSEQAAEFTPLLGELQNAVAEEAKRVNVENERVKAEEQRAQDSKTRLEELEQAKTNTETATGEANTARDEAKKAATDATSAAGKATDAAGLAETAKTNANTAAEEANDAATKAEAAARKADGAADTAVTAASTADEIVVDKDGNAELVARVSKVTPKDSDLLNFGAGTDTDASFVVIPVDGILNAASILCNSYKTINWSNKSGYIYSRDVSDIVIRDDRFTSKEKGLFGGFCGRDSGIGPAQRAKTTIWN